MTKEDLLPPELERILEDIEFVKKYKLIWEKYEIENESYYISDIEIISIFNKLGYKLVKRNKEQYFSDFFNEDKFCYRIGITIKYNIIHFDISIRNKLLNIRGGGGYGLLVQLMTNWQMPIKSPCFYNLNSFKNLSKDLIDLFEEIKSTIEIRFRPE